MIRLTFISIIVLFPWYTSVEANEIIITEIQNGWNDIQTMSGEFSQLDSNGNFERGKFYFSKPYKSKFVYKNKNEDIITNESLLCIVDKKGFQVDSYAIGSNVLKKLLSINLNIQKEFEINFVKENENSYEIGSISKNGNSLEKIVLTFNKNTIELEKLKKNIFISQNLFVVRY